VLANRVIAVTGANGFIGREVSADLLRRGFTVRAVVREPTFFELGIEAYLCPQFADRNLLREAFRGAATVIHLAGRAHVMTDRDDADEVYTKINVEGTRAVAEAAAVEGVGQIIFASSVKAIGEGGSTILNDVTEPRPRDAYGRSKLAAEGVAYRIAADSGMSLTVLRFPLVYGPGVKGNVLRLFNAVWRGIPLPVGGIRNRRSMLSTGNLGAFVARLLEHPLASTQPFLLSDGDDLSTESLVRAIGDALGRKPKIFTVPMGLLRGLARVGDAATIFGLRLPTSVQIDRLTGSLIVDSSRAWNAAKISPALSLHDGLTLTAQWYRDRSSAR
jgi:nucleoside-diphosphate-sugar epimerase